MIETKPGIAKGNNDYLESIRQKLGHGYTDKAETREAKKELGKDDFIKLMSVQLKYQDPLSPLKNEEMAAQLAQYSGLEQMTNVNRNLEKMATANNVRDNMMAASLIGKQIETDSAKFKLTEDRKATLSFNLPESIESGKLSVLDSKGEIVRDLILEKSEKGEQQIAWDGRKESGINADIGDYTFRVTAYSRDGKSVQAKTSTAGTVTGIEFDKGRPILLVGSEKVYMDVVSKIIDPGSPPTKANTIAGDKPQAEMPKIEKQMPTNMPAVSPENLAQANRRADAEQLLSFPMGKNDDSVQEDALAANNTNNNQVMSEKADQPMVLDSLWNPNTGEAYNE